MTYHRGVVHVAVVGLTIYADCHYCSWSNAFGLGWSWSPNRIHLACTVAREHAQEHFPAGEPS